MSGNNSNTVFQFRFQDSFGTVLYLFGVGTGIFYTETADLKFTAAIVFVGLTLSYLIAFYKVYRPLMNPHRPSLRVALSTGFYFLGFVPTLWPGLDLLTHSAVLLSGAFLSLYLSRYKVVLPFTRKRIRQLLSDCIDEYKDTVPGEYGLRANVMLVRRKHPLTRERYLETDFYTDDYSIEETFLQWDSGEGAVGKVLDMDDQVWLDAERASESDAEWIAESEQIAVTHIQSLLSTPIFVGEPVDDNLVGVLNLDSKDHISETKMDSEEAREIGVKYANRIASVL